MGKGGRPRKPTQMKLIQGTFRPDRAMANEPQPETGIPTRPTWLGKVVPWGREAIREWDRVAPHLADLKLLSEIDRANLVAYCDAFGRFWYYRRRVAEVGDVQVTETGYRAQNPEMSYMTQALKDLHKFGALFGMSPSDRTRISVPEKKEGSGNAFLDALAGGKK